MLLFYLPSVEAVGCATGIGSDL